MKGERCFKRWIILIWLCLGVFLLSTQESLAQFSRISVRGSTGAGYLPLKDWENFSGDIQLSHFTKDRFGSYWGLDIDYRITENHIIALTVEDIKTSASLFGVAVFTTIYDTIGYASYVIDWNFKATPLGISYEFYPTGLRRKISPFLGIGISYFISEVKATFFEIHNSLFEKQTQEGTRDGKGYGFHAYIGLQSQIMQQLYLVSRLRGRYANGMGLTDKEGDIKVEFTGIDFTFGVGWRF